jgi:hypothetical protein
MPVDSAGQSSNAKLTTETIRQAMAISRLKPGRLLVALLPEIALLFVSQRGTSGFSVGLDLYIYTAFRAQAS